MDMINRSFSVIDCEQERYGPWGRRLLLEPYPWHLGLHGTPGLWETNDDDEDAVAQVVNEVTELIEEALIAVGEWEIYT